MTRWGAAVGALLSAGMAGAAPLPRDAVTPDAKLGPAVACLVFSGQVCDELGLSESDQSKVYSIGRKLFHDVREDCLSVVGRRNATPAELQQVYLDYRRAVRRAAAELTATLLTPAQRIRLVQLDRRIRGPLAFTDPGVSDALALTDSQVRAMSDAVEVYQGADDRLRNGEVDGDEAKLRDDRLAAREAATKAIDDVLTPAQRDAWMVLLGRPVKRLDPAAAYLFLRADDRPGLDLPAVAGQRP